MKAYFNRQQPFYLIGADEIDDTSGFDAYEVDIDEITMANVRSVRRLIDTMEAKFFEGGAPEESAQEEASFFAGEVRRIFKTRAQYNG